MKRIRTHQWAVVAVAVGLLGACNAGTAEVDSTELPPAVTSLPPVTTTSTTSSTTSTTTTTTTTLPPTFDLSGFVSDVSGSGLADATVVVGNRSEVTSADGSFNFVAIEPGAIAVSRPGWLPVTVEWAGNADQLDITMEPRVIRGLRATGDVASSPELFAKLLDQAENSAINALVFDTKDETSKVLYESESEFAAEIGSVEPRYDPIELIAMAKDRGLYTITRIVTFEDKMWVRERPDHKLAGRWIDPTLEDAWEYPLQLAVEACEIGFDEIQFDYVRFPAGQTAVVAQQRKPMTEEERVATIAAFLSEARSRLHPLGCALSADIFAIVLSSPGDEGIGHRPEEVSASVDAVSPMIYPSHYSDGWLGFPDPNEHPGPVVGDALDNGMPRLAPGALMRPWLQAFYYNTAQVQTEIEEAEARGVGWILWNASGNYADSWLPEQEAE